MTTFIALRHPVTISVTALTNPHKSWLLHFATAWSTEAKLNKKKYDNQIKQAFFISNFKGTFHE